MFGANLQNNTSSEAALTQELIRGSFMQPSIHNRSLDLVTNDTPSILSHKIAHLSFQSEHNDIDSGDLVFVLKDDPNAVTADVLSTRNFYRSLNSKNHFNSISYNMNHAKVQNRMATIQFVNNVLKQHAVAYYAKAVATGDVPFDMQVAAYTNRMLQRMGQANGQTKELQAAHQLDALIEGIIEESKHELSKFGTDPVESGNAHFKVYCAFCRRLSSKTIALLLNAWPDYLDVDAADKQHFLDGLNDNDVNIEHPCYAYMYALGLRDDHGVCIERTIFSHATTRTFGNATLKAESTAPVLFALKANLHAKCDRNIDCQLDSFFGTISPRDAMMQEHPAEQWFENPRMVSDWATVLGVTHNKMRSGVSFTSKTKAPDYAYNVIVSRKANVKHGFIGRETNSSILNLTSLGVQYSVEYYHIPGFGGQELDKFVPFVLVSTVVLPGHVYDGDNLCMCYPHSDSNDFSRIVYSDQSTRGSSVHQSLHFENKQKYNDGRQMRFGLKLGDNAVAHRTRVVVSIGRVLHAPYQHENKDNSLRSLFVKHSNDLLKPVEVELGCM